MLDEDLSFISYLLCLFLVLYGRYAPLMNVRFFRAVTLGQAPFLCLLSNSGSPSVPN